MQAQRLRVRFNDEAPRIGSGVRTVLVTIGRKIVRVTDEYGHRAKFSKALWNEISKRNEVPLADKKNRRKQWWRV